MTLVSPRIIALDSSTLGVVAKDFWSTDTKHRLKAETFVSELRERGLLVAFAVNHIVELLRHENDTVAWNRLRFLNSLPLIAWVPPFAGLWPVGSLIELLVRELTAFRTGKALGWENIVEQVRSDLWKIGAGGKLFANDPRWTMFRSDAQQHHAHEKYVASVTRSQAGGITKMTIGESRVAPKRSPQEWRTYFPEFAADMHRRLQQHGDPRLTQPEAVAGEFALRTMKRAKSFDFSKGDIIDQLIERTNIPKELAPSSLTIEQLGELAIYAKQLEHFGELLKPPCRLSMVDVPIDTLPTYVLERRLRSLQQRADRVSGSDVGDGQLAVLVLYADCVQVDKRTCHYLKQVKRSEPKLGDLMCPFITEADYSNIPARVA